MDTIALILSIVGSLNWGLVGLFQFDLVAWLFGGQDSLFSRIIYTVIALAGAWCISLLFRKFASDVAVRYHMPAITLDASARDMLERYSWPGNVRQLKNVAEAVSALESVRISGLSDKCVIDVDVLSRYIPKEEPNLLPAKVADASEAYDW